MSLNNELDPFDLLYWFLEKTGLIWDVYRPSDTNIDKKRRVLTPPVSKTGQAA